MGSRINYLLGALVLLVLLIASSIFWFPFSSTSSPKSPLTFLENIASSTTAILIPPKRSDYIYIVDSCGPGYDGACAVARSGPATSSAILAQLRTGMVLKVQNTVSKNGTMWYKIAFDEWLRYPERVENDWYVANTSSIEVFKDLLEEQSLTDTSPKTAKRIIVDRSDQMLTAYDGDTVFMKEPISTGLDLTPTPRGIFSVFRKTPSRYMQGPLPNISDQYYDLPGVPWNLYFTEQGAVIHGAYWHNNFGQPWSHGCVNLPPEKARELYDWAEVGTKVIVRD